MQADDIKQALPGLNFARSPEADRRLGRVYTYVRSPLAGFVSGMNRCIADPAISEPLWSSPRSDPGIGVYPKRAGTDVSEHEEKHIKEIEIIYDK
jgi:hypothetical protein